MPARDRQHARELENKRGVGGICECRKEEGEEHALSKEAQG